MTRLSGTSLSPFMRTLTPLTNTTASKPKLRASYSGDYYLRKANFIRLKNVEVGYNFHGDFFSKTWNQQS
jgi:hypothetical protein